MKKVIFASGAFMLCFLMSCKDAKTTNTTTSSTAETNRNNMSAVYAGIQSGDMSKMDAFVSADIVDHGMPMEIKGRDSVKKMLADMHNHFTNLKMDMVAEATSADNLYHFALVRMTGTTTDDKMGRPANTPVDETSIDVVKLSDGKVVEHWSFQDSKMMMKMMGMDKGMDHMDGKMMDDKMMNDKMMNDKMMNDKMMNDKMNHKDTTKM